VPKMPSEIGIVPADGGPPKRILIADDSGVVRAVLKHCLDRWGYEVVVAQDGDEAWRVLDGPDAPSIALLDWMMPGRDGLEVCRLVRAANRQPYTYIILLTGKDDQQDIVRGLTAGADDYLKKPFDNAELEARLGTARRIVEAKTLEMAGRRPRAGRPAR
jgi:two-component system cell cycle response regulator